MVTSPKPVGTGSSSSHRLSNASFVSASDQQCCFRKFRPIDPERSVFLRSWDVFTAASLIFVCLVSPYEIAFVSSEGLGPEWLASGADGLFWINRFIDVVFVIDMCMQFFIMYPTPQKYYYITDRKSIAKHYLRTWFFVDLVSVLPFDIIGIVAQRSNVRQLRFLRVVRLLRLLKLARLLRGLRILKRWEAEVSFSYRNMTMSMLIVTVGVSAHWISCALGIINMLQGDVCTGSGNDTPDCQITWFSPAAMEYNSQGQELTSYRKYIVALYAASTMIVHPHVYSPQNEWERHPFIVLIFVGGFIWTRVISRSTALITSMDRHLIHYQQTMDDVHQISLEQKLPHALRKRLRYFFMNTRDCSQRQTWKSLTLRMSPNLKTEVLYQAAKNWIRRVPYLATTSKFFLMEVTEEVQSHYFAQKEHFGFNFVLYIVVLGMCNWSKGAGKVVMLRPGSVWGEEHLFLSDYKLLRPNTATSLTFSEVLSLQRKVFDEICSHHPEQHTRMRRFYRWYVVSRSVIMRAQEVKLSRQNNLSQLSSNDRQSFCVGDDEDDYHALHAARARRDLKNHTVTQHTSFNKRLTTGEAAAAAAEAAEAAAAGAAAAPPAPSAAAAAAQPAIALPQSSVPAVEVPKPMMTASIKEELVEMEGRLAAKMEDLILSQFAVLNSKLGVALEQMNEPVAARKKETDCCSLPVALEGRVLHRGLLSNSQRGDVAG